MITYKQEVITPEEAKLFLDTMVKNRNISPGRLKALKGDISKGEYKQNPNPICFNKKGELIDGQHRLTAIMETGVSELVTIAYNVDDDAIIDRGMERTVGNSLYMRGVTDKELSGTVVIAIARLYFLVKYSENYASESDIGTFINDNEDNLLKALHATKNGNIFTGKAPVKLAVFGAFSNGASEEKMSRFVKCLSSGFANENESAAIVLRNYIVGHNISGRNGRKRLVSVAEQSIFDFLQGKPRKRYYSNYKFIYCIPERNGKHDGERKDLSGNPVDHG